MRSSVASSTIATKSRSSSTSAEWAASTKRRHRALDRTIAIKFIHPHLLTADVVVQRFMVEAQTASQLNHPNVISIFDFGRTVRRRKAAISSS